MNKNEKIVLEFSDLIKAFDDMFTGANSESVKESTESDMVSKYKKLYEASLTLQNLKNEQERVAGLVAAYQEKTDIIMGYRDRHTLENILNVNYSFSSRLSTC